MGVLEGKVAMITGAGTGIGRAIALAFAREDAKVVLTGRRMDNLEETAHLCGEKTVNALPVPCDLTDNTQIAGLVKTALDKFGQIDVLVNNAGVMRTGNLNDAEDGDFDLIMKTNVWAPWKLSRAVIPHMKAKGGGSIVMISSVAGLRAIGGVGIYCASKAALQILAQTFALEHAEDLIRVNVICPALVEGTELFDVNIGGAGGRSDFYNKLKTSHPLGRNGRPGDIADAALYLASEASRWVTGVILPVDGGRMLTSLRPKEK